MERLDKEETIEQTIELLRDDALSAFSVGAVIDNEPVTAGFGDGAGDGPLSIGFLLLAIQMKEMSNQLDVDVETVAEMAVEANDVMENGVKGI